MALIATPNSLGIIPACAGNSGEVSDDCLRHRDHPRVCGEQSESLFYFLLDLGSSPRVRGTGLKEMLHRVRQGIIPACAGNSNKS